MNKNILLTGQSLWRNESSENKLISENGLYELVLQKHDGNLVLYDMSSKEPFPVFASNTQNSKVEAAVFQEDGNFVLYENGTNRKNPKWASSTENTLAHKLKLENSGAICLYDKNDKLVFVINSQRWMSALNDSLRLKDICMPGSHDAGMYFTTQKYAPGLALTQSKNFREQLDFGIRYFDLRPQYWSKNSGENRFYAYHGAATGPLIKDILNDIKSFFEHPNGNMETVIIGLTHFKDFNDSVKIDLLNYIIEKLDGYIHKLPNGKNLGSLKLSDVRGKIIFLLDVGDEEFTRLTVTNYSISDFFTRKTFGSCVFDEYSDTKYYTTMYEKQIEYFKSFREDKLFLLNWTLTPDDGIIGGIKAVTQSYTSVKTYAKEINPRLSGWGHAREGLFKPNQHGKIVNILNGDFWEEAGNDVMKVCFEIMNNR